MAETVQEITEELIATTECDEIGGNLLISEEHLQVIIDRISAALYPIHMERALGELGERIHRLPVKRRENKNTDGILAQAINRGVFIYPDKKDGFWCAFGNRAEWGSTIDIALTKAEEAGK